MGRWLPAGEIRLQGYKIRELELKDNLLRLRFENRSRESLSLALHGPVSLRDRGVPERRWPGSGSRTAAI